MSFVKVDTQDDGGAVTKARPATSALLGTWATRVLYGLVGLVAIVGGALLAQYIGATVFGIGKGEDGAPGGGSSLPTSADELSALFAGKQLHSLLAQNARIDGNLSVHMVSVNGVLNVDGTVYTNSILPANITEPLMLGSAGSEVMIAGIVWDPAAIGKPGTINCTDGAPGLPGERGERGFNGTDGVLGLQGLQGERGERGFNGTDGAPGLQGLQGERGERGFNGTDGAQGLQGERGERGFNGTDGARGLQGYNGTDGARGLQGLQGERGERGFNGTDGAQGPIGTFDGSTLDSPTITGMMQAQDIRASGVIRSDTRVITDVIESYSGNMALISANVSLSGGATFAVAGKGITFANGGASVLDYYEETTHDMEFVGPCYLPLLPGSLVRVGKMVHMVLPGTGCVQVSGGWFSSTLESRLPPRFKPKMRVVVAVSILSGFTNMIGLAEVTVDGDVRVFFNGHYVGFPSSSGGAGFYDLSASWLTN